MKSQLNVPLSELSFAMLAALLLALPFLGAAPTQAEVRTGQTVVVKQREVVLGNLYAAGGTVMMHGTVQGDVVAVGGTIVIDGPVIGDVLAAGGQVTISGRVDGDIRVTGGQVSLLAPVGGDVAIGGGNVHVDGNVTGDAMLAAGAAALTGDVGHSLYAGVGELHVVSEVGGDIVVQGGRLVLEDGAQVIGDVTYTGPEDIVRHSGSIVGGAIVQHPFVGAGPRWLAMVLGWLQLLVGMFALGLIWLLAFRGFAQRSIQTLREHPGLCFGIGTAAFVGVPLVIGLVFVVGAFVGGAWLGVFGISIYGMAMALCFPLIAAAFGLGTTRRTVGSAGSIWWPLLLALVVLTALLQVPVVGALVGLATAIFGLGAISLTLVPTLRFTHAPTAETAPLPSPMPATSAAPARAAA